MNDKNNLTINNFINKHNLIIAIIFCYVINE